MVAVTKEINNDSPKAGKWQRECSVEFKFHDIDHASKFAGVLAELLSTADGGGDFEINGKQIGHDVHCSQVVLKAP